MSGVKASVTQVRFKSVIQAFQEAGIPYEETNPNNCLVWYDSLKESDYFKLLMPWQIVNRIPNMQLICRKASFARIIQHMMHVFPDLYKFIPKTYILPFESKKLIRAIAKKKVRHIIKPDNGSLGQGIIVIDPGNEYSPDDMLAVGQEYIESHLIDDKKYDLRVYALIATVTPLTIYVFRNGVARFCSETSKDSKSKYSLLTNIGLNKENVDPKEMAEISKLITEVIPKIGLSEEELWSRIDQVIVLSILSCHRFLEKGVSKNCKALPYPRCFQILGFDILLDTNLMPHVLEVNYRPSLDYYRPAERRMKVAMLRDAMLIACPLGKIQPCVMERQFAWEVDSWDSFVADNPELMKFIESERREAVENSNFAQVFPTPKPIQEVYDMVLKKAKDLPLPFLPDFNLSK